MGGIRRMKHYIHWLVLLIVDDELRDGWMTRPRRRRRRRVGAAWRGARADHVPPQVACDL